MDGADRHDEVQILVQCQPGRMAFRQPLRRLGGGQRARRRHRPPRPAAGRDRPSPLGQPRLARVDLLALADQRHDHRPARHPRHDLQHVPGLGGGQDGTATLRVPPRLGGVPGTLGLVEHHHMLGRRLASVAHMVLQEAVHVLQHGARLAPGLAGAAALPVPRVPLQRAAQHRHQRRVAGEKGGARFRPGIRQGAESQVQPAQRLARAGNAGDEHHAPLPRRPRLLNGVADGIGGAAEVARTGPRRGDGLHPVSVEQPPRRLDAGGH